MVISTDINLLGGMAERTNALVLKTSIPARVSWVRIPLPPPRKTIMELEVILFAIYKERLQSNSVIVELPEDSTVEQLVNQLRSDYPQIATLETNIVVAVNSEYSEYDLKLKSTDEICLIPPVSGG